MNSINNSPHVSTIFKSLLTICLFASLVFSASGQTSTSATDGFTPSGLTVGAPAGSYALSGLENVNPYNGGLNFSLPLMQVGGRGGAQYTMLLPIEQRWRILQFNFPNGSMTAPDYNWWTGLQPRYGPGVVVGRASGDDLSYYCPYQDSTTFHRSLTRLTFITPNGTEYELRDQLTGGQPAWVGYCASQGASRGTVFVTADGTAATFISDTLIRDDLWGGDVYPSGYLMLRDGTRYRIDQGNVTWMRDRNGNKLSFSYLEGQNGWATSVTDSLNREVTFDYATPTRPYDEISFKGFGGASRTIRVWNTTLGNALRSGSSLQSCYALFPGTNASSSGYCEPFVISEVTLPDGRSYKFRYNSYAELARVELPTGGVMEYDWAAGVNNGAASGMLLGNENVYRRVVERRIYSEAGTLQGRMTFSKPETEYNGNFQNLGYVDVAHYDGSQPLTTERHYYLGVGSAYSMGYSSIQYPAWNEFKEYRIEIFDAAGTLLRRAEHTWQQGVITSSWDTSIPHNPRISETTTTLEPSGANLVNKRTFTYDDSLPYNNQTDIYEYAYGSGAPGALVRRTHSDFLTTTNYTDASSGIHVRSLPLQSSVYDSAGVERARTTLEYDNYGTDANHATLVDRANISGLDAAFTTSLTARGNVTATTQYPLNTSGGVTGSITSYAQYDIAGNAVKAIDARGYTTLVDFTDRFGSPDGNARLNGGSLELNATSQYSYAFPTLVTNPLSQTIYAQFDYYLGRSVDGEDINGVVASGYYNDILDRPTQVRRAVGTPAANQTTFSYDDTNRVITTTSDQSTFGDNALVSKVFYDGLGRTAETRQYEGGSNYIVMRQEYDAMGRVFKTSSPFRPWQSESAVWTATGFDALGRVISMTTPDNAVVLTSYSGNQVTVTDQAGKARRSVTDALGRLIQVYEDPTGFNYLTSYAYDTLDNLTTVTQGSQQRFFMYDSLKRLIRARNPEQDVNAGLSLSDPFSGNSQWSMGYSYDSNGNLSTKTDARGISTSYAYDALNRNTTVDYSDTTGINPDITRIYDTATNGKGRLRESYSGGSETVGASVEHTKVMSYDALGRPIDQRQRFKTNGTWSQSYTTQRGYNLAGGVTSQTYPSGRSGNYSYDSAGRANSFSGNLGDGMNRTYASGISYSAFGGLKQEQFGTDQLLQHRVSYNVRGQTCYVALGVGDGDYGKFVYYYGNAYSFCSSGTDNNGNISLIDYYLPGGALIHDHYNYDSLNRLSEVWEEDTQFRFKQKYNYDRYGNRTIDAAQSSGGVNEQQFDVNPANNRLSVPGGQSGTMSYDLAGNLTTDTYTGAGSRSYDAENRMTSAGSAGASPAVYTYNADGQRVRRTVNGVETWQVYGIDGELLAEYAANGAPTNPQKEYGYRNPDGSGLLITAEAGSSGTGPQDVIWTSAVGVSVSGNNLTKTSSVGWNAGAVSTQSINSGDGYVEFTANANSANTIFGLSHGDTNQSYEEIDFALYPWTDGNLYIFENGANPAAVGPYTAGDTLRVAIEGGVVKYRKNGTLLYTSTVAPTYPLLVDTTMHPSGSQITNAVISNGSGGGSTQNASWSSAVGVSISSNTLTKTGTNGWNAGAVSTQTIAAGDGYMEFTATADVANVLCGLSNGDTNQSYEDIDFALYPWTDGNLYVFEGGTSRGSVGPYTVGDVFRVAVEGGVVKYRKNGTLLYTSAVAPTYPLLVDSTIFPQGGKLTNAVLGGNFSGGTSSSAIINWLVTDQLGTPRMIIDKTGSLANVRRHDYLPFGEELLAAQGSRTTTLGYSGDAIRQKFTSKERDNETGLDYFLARYYSSTQARFTSPDEFSGGPDELYDFAEAASENPTFYADLTNPQSLNKYQYTYNNPLNMVDPDGHCPDCPPVIGAPAGVGLSLEVLKNPGRAVDVVQTVLSVIGMVPGAGEIADLANAGISGARGNYAEAAMDIAGAAGPVVSAVAVGNRIRKIAKVASKADDVLEAGADVSKGISKSRKQIFQDFSTRRRAIDARPKPLPAQKGEARVTRQSKNKAGMGTKSEKHDRGGRHVHDDRHNKNKKPNKHYGFPD
jgi:RHS repeat-associated protein